MVETTFWRVNLRNLVNNYVIFVNKFQNFVFEIPWWIWNLKLRTRGQAKLWDTATPLQMRTWLLYLFTRWGGSNWCRKFNVLASKFDSTRFQLTFRIADPNRLYFVSEWNHVDLKIMKMTLRHADFEQLNHVRLDVWCDGSKWIVNM